MPNNKDKWLWKSEGGNVYIHCDDILYIAELLRDDYV